ncbi:MAG: ATP-dependent Clp protease adaptor ClpS [Pirellulaceae bacterium]|nr:ATP-dependent Clp protease adaptor ClpS [Pirellulaceae bacterium]
MDASSDDPNPYRSPSVVDDRQTHRIILHNDPINDIVFVVRSLRSVFDYGYAKSIWLTLKVHCWGRGVIWVGSHAESSKRADQITAIGPDPSQVLKGVEPLSTSIERFP